MQVRFVSFDASYFPEEAIMLLRRIAIALAVLGSSVCTSVQALTLGFTLADPGLGAPGGYFHMGSAEGAGRVAALGDVKTYLGACRT